MHAAEKKTDQYQVIRRNIRYYIPSSSVIGQLLPTNGRARAAVVVKSTAKGFFQHDLKTWQICGFRFERSPKRNVQSVRAIRRVRAWIARVPKQQREHFTDVLFQVVYATGVTTFPELLHVKARQLRLALRELLSLKAADRRRIRAFLFLLRATISRI